MNSLDAINLLKKYDLYEAAQNECRRLKLASAPYDMMGHNKVYCQFLDNKWVELRKLADKKMKCKCFNLDAMKSQNSAHDDCFFNRLTFKKSGSCEGCSLAGELDSIETEMNHLSEASKVLKKAAEDDYTWR